VNSFNDKVVTCDVCLSQIIRMLSVRIGKSGLRRTCVALCEIRENSWSSASEKNADIGKVIWTVAVMFASLVLCVQQKKIRTMLVSSRLAWQEL